MEGLRIRSNGGRSKKTEPIPHHQIRFISTQDSPNPFAVLPILPHELINEILLRLPVKSLLRFKCVSKSWLSLISSPQFISSHLKVNTSRDKQRVLIEGFVDNKDGIDYGVKHCSLKCLLGDNVSDDVVVFDYPNLVGPLVRIVLVGSSDGLVCINANINDLFIWNPSTGKSKKLPDLGSSLRGNYVVFGFGYDGINDDYKVVAICSPFDNYGVLSSGVSKVSEVKVYSRKNESWKRVGKFEVGYIDLNGCGIFLNGRFHFASKKEDYPCICCFDLATETVGEMEVSDFDQYCELKLVDFQGTLCILGRHGIEYTDMWVMKEYGVKESWIKLLTIPIDVPEMCSIYKLLCTLLWTTEDGNILLINQPILALYNPKDSSYRNYRIELSSSSADYGFSMVDACVYVESLLSPNASDAPDRHDN